MKFIVLSLFPDYIKNMFSYSILKQAIENEIIELVTIQIRDFSTDKHKQVDDYPYGGGSGMILKVEPVYEAYQYALSLTNGKFETILMSPLGKTLHHAMSEEYSKLDSLILICGHYEGIDHRIIELIHPKLVSIGDYILTGGEVAAGVFINTISRHLPGVLGSSKSLQHESFKEGQLEYPQYTRPSVYHDLQVPEILLSGNHQAIENWRANMSKKFTEQYRPDLL